MILRLPREMVASTTSLDIFLVPLHWRWRPYVCIVDIDNDHGRNRVLAKVFSGRLLTASCTLTLL